MGRLLIIHYHLNPGGVTRIIESQILALQEAGFEDPVLVLTGKCNNQGFYKRHGTELIIHGKLNYMSEDADFEEEYSVLQAFLQEQIHPGDIVHFHNLNLGKNPVLTCLMRDWVRKGYRVINHAHDFAEDRPGNYAFLEKVAARLSGEKPKKIMYPDEPNHITLVLNHSDQERMRNYGLAEERLHLLPNPVIFRTSGKLPSEGLRAEICRQLAVSPEKKLITYPVRVIRRKNIGEYILLCRLFSDEANWVVTQPPKNPVEIEPYLRWKKFCADNRIPLIFEAGEKADFEGLLTASDFCFTTSIQEGFGMTFMEPWLLGTPVIGRNLQMVTRDLVQSGIEFPMLYDQLNVQVDGKSTDFGTLGMVQQMEYIQLLVNKPGKEKELFEYNPFLRNLLNSVGNLVIENNKSTIIKEYSLLKYGQRLKSIYKKPA